MNPSADPNGVYDTPAFVCFDARTNSIQPFPFTLPENSPVDPVVFTTAVVNGVECPTAGQIQWQEAEPWTLEKTAEVTWVDADRIEEAVKLYAATKSGIGTGQFADMSELSSNFIYGTMALDMLCGKVDKPGVVLTEQKPESRWTHRPTQFWCTRPYQETFGVGWTVGLTLEENTRRSQAAVDAWNAKGVDGEKKRQDFVDYQRRRRLRPPQGGPPVAAQRARPCARGAADRRAVQDLRALGAGGQQVLHHEQWRGMEPGLRDARLLHPAVLHDDLHHLRRRGPVPAPAGMAGVRARL